MRHRTESAILSSHTSKHLGPASIKTAARRDAAALIHNETQSLAAAAGSPAKAVKRKTSCRINEALNFFSFFSLLLHSYRLHLHLLCYYVIVTQNGVAMYCQMCILFNIVKYIENISQ